MTGKVATYMVIIEESDNGYAAYLPELPGCVAAGDTEEETKTLIQEAVMEHLALLAEAEVPVPAPAFDFVSAAPDRP